MVSEVLDALAERLRNQWGPYTHPGLTAPDPDCHCEGCVLDALATEDRAWLIEAGWSPRRSGITVYTYLPSNPVLPCVFLQVVSLMRVDRLSVAATFMPLEAGFPSLEVTRFVDAAPRLIEGQFGDALDESGYASIRGSTRGYSTTAWQRRDQVSLTIELNLTA